MPMLAGFAALDITPPPGAEMPGGFAKRHNTGVHDPLLVKAMVLDDGKSRLAIVGVDALSLKRSLVQRARALAHAACGIPPGRIMAAASHTHTGGPAADCLGSESDPAYLHLLARRIAQAITLADRQKVPARLGAGVGHEDTVAFNRRFVMKNGRQATHPGKGNPDIVRVAGPIDPQLGVLAAWKEDGGFLGCLINYTCHCTVIGGLQISADYPYYLDVALRGALGEDAVIVFTNGAYGDVTQVANTLIRERETGEKWAQRIGHILAGEALKVIARLDPTPEGWHLQGAQRLLELEPRPVPADRLAQARALLAREGPWDTERWYARELVLLHAMNERESRIPAEVQTLAIGPAAYVGIPGEYFCQFGLEIKAASPFPQTAIVGTANGCVGYICTREALDPETGGGYEPRLARSSKLTATAGEQLREAALQLLRSLNPPDPLPPTAGEPTPPWDVGASPPAS